MAIPTDIAGLYVWYKADAGTSTTTDGVGISQWDDQSGNARHATQATAANQPVYKAAILNTLPVLRHSNASAVQYLNLPDLSALTAATVFVVIQIALDPPAVTGDTGIWDLGSDTQNTHFPFTDGIIYDAFGSTARKTTVNPTPSLASQFRTYCVVSTSSEWTSYLDGTQLFTTATNTVGLPISTAAALGKSHDGFGLNGDIAEFFLFNSGLSTSDRQSMEAYITAKWFTPALGPPGVYVRDFGQHTIGPF